MDSTIIIIMSTALLFYTFGVWSEKIQGSLKFWHLILFISGFICDTLGTGMMFELVGSINFSIHGISGFLAIILMFIHVVWAIIVLIKKDEHQIKNFHKFSIFVWIIWLIPYFTPIFINIIK